MISTDTPHNIAGVYHLSLLNFTADKSMVNVV